MRPFPESRSAQHSTTLRRRALAVIDLDLAVDDHEIDPNGILIRRCKGRAINYRFRIEDRDICEVALANQTTILDSTSHTVLRLS